MKIKSKLLYLVLAVCLCWSGGIQVFASDGEDYITISIDATDDNSELMYALDSDDPDAFTKSNEFRIMAGTSHTIYVKDAAGNITSQQYSPTGSSSSTAGDSDQNIDINLEVGGGSGGSDQTTSKYDYLTDTPVEEGEGTVYDRVTTDGSMDSSRVFFDITTEEGDAFYLVVNQGSSANNAYLLKQVTNSDLQSLAVDDTGAQKEQENEESLLQALAEEEADAETITEPEEEGDNNNIFLVLACAAGAAAYYYYFKVYRKKKRTELELEDAPDMDEFEAEEDELDFEYDESEKEAFLEQLVESDDFDMIEDFEDEETFATSQMDDEDLEFEEKEE